MRNGTRKLAVLSVTVAVAMMLSFIESRLPSFVPIPGVKLGLANIAVIFALYRLGLPSAIGVSTVRVLLSALLFGSPVSALYSLGGAALSLLGMVIFARVVRMHTVAVSIAGGILHNAGQIAVACLMLGTSAIIYYLPFLIISGTLAGTAVGVAASLLVKRIDLK